MNNRRKVVTLGFLQTAEAAVHHWAQIVHIEMNHPSMEETEELRVETCPHGSPLAVLIPEVYPARPLVEAVVHADVKALDVVSRCWSLH